MCLGIPARICALRVDNPKLAQVEWWPADVLPKGAPPRQGADPAARDEINLAVVLDATTPAHSLIGCWVITHLGFALRVVDEQEAALIGNLLAQLTEAREAVTATQSKPPQLTLDVASPTSVMFGVSSCTN